MATACQQGQAPLLPDAAVLVPIEIVSSSDTVAIPPEGSHRLGFQLLAAKKVPVPGAVMEFAILDDPNTPGSGDARLSMSSGLTDEQGWVILQVIAGDGLENQKPLTFHIKASAGDVFRKIPIFVTRGNLASAEIVLDVESPSNGEDALASTSLYFYDDTVCADVSRDNPTPGIRGEHKLASEERSTQVSGIVTSGVHAVLAVATGTRGRTIATGCADLPGNSLSPSQIVRVLLPLNRIHMSPLGTYRAEALFPLLAQQASISSVRQRWQKLSEGPCDPASIWLDCTIDALSGDSADDPLDCQPVTDGEGALGALLTARRALPGGRSCANQIDASGQSSLDTKTYALFASKFLLDTNLAKLPDDLNTTLSKLTVQSILSVKESSSPNSLTIEHVLDTLILPGASVQMPMTAMSLGLPVRDMWFESPQPNVGQLAIGAHGFTLRLGSLARLVYYKTSLAPRLGPADAGAFISTLYHGAVRNTPSNTLQGCDALDSLLCEEAGLDPGCIRGACQTGLQSLVQRLDSSFDLLDGAGLDFFLWGTATLADSDGDGQADTLAGFMTATFNAQTSSTANAWWSAQRVSPSSSP